MADISLDLILKYPLIDVVRHDNKIIYQGQIFAGGRDYDLIIIEKNRQGLVRFKLKSDLGPEIRKLVHAAKQWNIVNIMDAITAALDNNYHPADKNSVNIYKRVLYEYSEFTKFHLNVKSCKITPDLSQINLIAMDEAGRLHTLGIAVNMANACDIFQPSNIDLPAKFENDLSKCSSNLTVTYDQFLAALELLQPYFNLMDSIDENCGVLDPEKPHRKDCFRRIWIDQDLSVIVTVDPMNVDTRPDLKFLGPDRVVEKYRHKLNENLDWDLSVGVLNGILDILELEQFPPRPSMNAEMLVNVGECSICFSLRLNDKLPDIICPNKSCENYYHTECLYEWLAAVHSKRISNLIYGQCPNCEKVYSVYFGPPENSLIQAKLDYVQLKSWSTGGGTC